MKPISKNSIAVFYPQGFLDSNNTSSFLTIEDIESTIKLNVEMILVSLKKVIFFNRNGLEQFIKMFNRINKEKNITVGFCDYDTKKYNSIMKFYEQDLNFSLFKTLEIAELFSSNFKDQNKNVLIWSEDKSQRSAMAIEIHDRGHTPIIAQTYQMFKEKRESDKIDIAIEDTYLGDMGHQVIARVSSNAVIYTVSGFLDAEITNKFNLAYHNNSLNIGFRLFIFDAYRVVNMNIHAVNFFAKLSSASAEYNATICIVGLDFEKIPPKFKEELEDAGIMFFEKMDDILKDEKLLNELGASSAATIKHKRTINKQMIMELPAFIDATVKTIEMMTNSKAVKQKSTIEELKIEDNDKNLVASSIGFYGDMDGMAVLIFPMNIAKKSCELLIGESTDDKELILDSLAELVNIVGGKLKTLLSNAKYNINITLPRTYENIEDLLAVIGDKKGVKVDLLFDNEKFSFFLTR